MASNYELIQAENQKRYGTDIARIGPMLLADRYDDRTHFIFELLQNAEDALGKRGEWKGPRRVSFELKSEALTLSHFGVPFDEDDVRGVCGIAESTKDKSSIGRFGIGFKSVYTFTDCPEIHSGEEHFSIKNYVHPAPTNRVKCDPDETLIVLPLKGDDRTAREEIIDGFKRLGPSALLFLHSIEEINWSVHGGASGVYLRSKPRALGEIVHKINLIGEESGQEEVDEHWLVFHREVYSPEKEAVGHVEIAFSLQASKEQSTQWRIVPVATSPLVVFFPTAVETNLGFLIQGPYRTTPSRDNIPRNDPWNKHLVEETAALLVEALRWLRDQSMLDTSALSCLPIDPEKFPESSMFAPLYSAVRRALTDEALLPRFDGGYIASSMARLARTKELRELFKPEQLASLFGGEISGWLSGDITQDRTPEIRQYVMQELGVAEVTPTTVIPRLTLSFLEAQSDEWTLRLYEFLNGQGPSLRRLLDAVPLIRLADGTHVMVREKGKLQAFLPSDFETGFPTVSPSVCTTDEARKFLASLGITAPDPVDDVIWNVLPKYQNEEVNVDDDGYAGDIERIRGAFSTDSTAQKEKLRLALRDTNFVMVIDTFDGKAYVAKPGETYIATDRLQQLFVGVPDILIVDNKYDCLRGEDIRDLLVSCGASRYLIPQATPSGLGNPEKEQIRREAGLERASWESTPEDFTLRGLTQLLEHLSTLKPEEAAARGKVLWEALSDLVGRGTAVFYGSYKWGYSHETKVARFDASFIRILNQVAWVPNGDGELVPPNLVVFDTLGWKPNPFLLTKIAFKPPIIVQLAKEAGIDPAILDLVKEKGITLEALQLMVGGTEPASEEENGTNTEAAGDTSSADGSDVYQDAEDLYCDDMPDIPGGSHDPEGDDEVGRHGSGSNGRGGNRGSSSGHSGSRTGGSSNTGKTGGGGSANGKGSGDRGKRTPGGNGGRPFISYVGAHPEDEGPDPDGLDQAVRMQLEAKAIDRILQSEPLLKRTKDGNKGFDLYEADEYGNPIRWVEVKSMTGTLNDRPVGMSHAQFNLAMEKREAYWLYVVEGASDIEKARILKIQDPAGHARTFTFDRGWISIAQADSKDES